MAVVIATEEDETKVSTVADLPLRDRGACEGALEKWYSIRRSLGSGLIINCRCVASMFSRVIGGTEVVNEKGAPPSAVVDESNVVEEKGPD